MAEKLKEKAPMPGKVTVEAWREDFGRYEFRNGGKLVAKMEMAPGEVTLTWFKDMTYKTADGKEQMVVKDGEERYVLNTATWRIKEIGKPHFTHSAFLEEKKTIAIDDKIRREDGREFFHHFDVDLEKEGRAVRKNFMDMLKNPVAKSDWEAISSIVREKPGVFKLKINGNVEGELRMTPQGIVMSELYALKFTSNEHHSLTKDVNIGFVFDPDLHLRKIHVPGRSPIVLQEDARSVTVPVAFRKDGEVFSHNLILSVNESRENLDSLLTLPFMNTEWERIKQMKPLE